MANKLVSIVIPVYNAAAYIEATIKSVLAQTYTDWELILSDDCSTDDSYGVIEPFLKDERISYIRLNENVGAANTRNRGVKEAKGDYLCYLDSDDIWLPDKLKKELDFINKTGAAFAFTSYEFGDENACGTGKIVKVPETLTYRKALSRTVIFTSTVMFDLNKISKEEIMMPSVPSEDTASWWQILRSGYTAYGLNEVLTIYRRPKSSLSSNKGTAIKRIWNLYRNVEHLNIFESAYYFLFWAIRATLRRI